MSHRSGGLLPVVIKNLGNAPVLQSGQDTRLALGNAKAGDHRDKRKLIRDFPYSLRQCLLGTNGNQGVYKAHSRLRRRSEATF